MQRLDVNAERLAHEHYRASKRRRVSTANAAVGAAVVCLVAVVRFDQKSEGALAEYEQISRTFRLFATICQQKRQQIAHRVSIVMLKTEGRKNYRSHKKRTNIVHVVRLFALS